MTRLSQTINAIALTAILSAIPSNATTAPKPGVGNHLSGEATLTGVMGNITVDWMVYDLADPAVASIRSKLGLGSTPGANYAYLYQIENSSGMNIEGMSLTLPDPSNTYTTSIIHDDLDNLAAGLHGAHNIPGDTEGLAASDRWGATIQGLQVNPPSADWMFFNNPFMNNGARLPGTLGIDEAMVAMPNLLGLAPGTESSTLVMVSDLGPVFGEASVFSSGHNTVWSGSIPVAMANPEPGTYAMLGTCLLVAGVARRRQRSSPLKTNGTA